MMTLIDLVNMTRAYARDTNSQMFKKVLIVAFLNQAQDRLKQYKVFEGMTELVDDTDTPIVLPSHYHYMLALFASSRCYDMDERFYEGVEKRNEFEGLLESLIGEVQAGNVILVDAEGKPIEDGTIITDYVRDVYFKRVDEDATIL